MLRRITAHLKTKILHRNKIPCELKLQTMGISSVVNIVFFAPQTCIIIRLYNTSSRIYMYTEFVNVL